MITNTPNNYELDSEYRNRQMNNIERLRLAHEAQEEPEQASQWEHYGRQLLQANAISVAVIFVSVISIIYFFGTGIY